jgi:hypothetical protein
MREKRERERGRERERVRKREIIQGILKGEVSLYG